MPCRSLCCALSLPPRPPLAPRNTQALIYAILAHLVQPPLWAEGGGPGVVAAGHGEDWKDEVRERESTRERECTLGSIFYSALLFRP